MGQPQTAPRCPSPAGRGTIRCPGHPAPAPRTRPSRWTAGAPALRRSSAHPGAVTRRPAARTPHPRPGRPARRCRPARRPAARACASLLRPAPVPASPVRRRAAGAPAGTPLRRPDARRRTPAPRAVRRLFLRAGRQPGDPARAGCSGAAWAGPAVPGVRGGRRPSAAASYRFRWPGRVSGVRSGPARPRPRRRRPRRRPHRCRPGTSPRAGAAGAGVSGAWRAVVVPAGCPSVPAPPARPVPSLLTTVLVTLRAPVHPVVPGAG
ncbi:hypothetical protein SUDANB171_05091 [Streptomyces sp. enrichment culture]